MRLRNRLATAFLIGLPGALFAAPPQHFTLSASFVPAAKPRASASVSVSFVPRDPDVQINEEPAPRLKLDPEQPVLIDKQAPAAASVKPYDPDAAKYLDLRAPFSFPVALAPGAPKEPHSVKATVIYFYCSKREGWCRKGSTEVEFTVP